MSNRKSAKEIRRERSLEIKNTLKKKKIVKREKRNFFEDRSFIKIIKSLMIWFNYIFNVFSLLFI